MHEVIHKLYERWTVNDGLGPLLPRAPQSRVIKYVDASFSGSRDSTPEATSPRRFEKASDNDRRGCSRGRRASRAAPILRRSRFCRRRRTVVSRDRESAAVGSLCRYSAPGSDERRNWDLRILRFLHWQQAGSRSSRQDVAQQRDVLHEEGESPGPHVESFIKCKYRIIGWLSVSLHCSSCFWTQF